MPNQNPSAPAPMQVPPPPPPPPAGGQPPPSGGFPTMLVIAAAILVLVLLGVGYMMLTPGLMQPAPADMAGQQVPQTDADALQAELDAFSTTGLDTEMGQIEQELAQ